MQLIIYTLFNPWGRKGDNIKYKFQNVINELKTVRQKKCKQTLYKTQQNFYICILKQYFIYKNIYDIIYSNKNQKYFSFKNNKKNYF